LFYGPLHFLIVRHIVTELGAASSPLSRILDLGCGTGAGGAAWALQIEGRRPTLTGIDVNAWVVAEARWTWKQLGLSGQVTKGDLSRVRLPGRASGILAAYVANELNYEPRQALLERLLESAGRGARILVIEPIARRIAPWWDEWVRAFEERGGRADTWRFRAALPERVRLLDRAAGLDHGELTARSLYLDGA
jgi:ubiquinone/menaquinone biosynthesis C-methylase UbiE